MVVVFAVAAIVAVVAVRDDGATGAGSDGPTADRRADQARTSAIEAGLAPEVADFLALAARAPFATYRATYPTTDATSTVVVTTSDGALRVDIVSIDVVTEVRLVVDGTSWSCPRSDEGTYACTVIDAVVDGPGIFGEDALARLTESLRARIEDYDFVLRDEVVADVDATCLVTTVRAGRDRPDLVPSATLCLAPSGAIVRMDRDGERFEASAYAATVPEDAFVRPDDPDAPSPTAP